MRSILATTLAALALAACASTGGENRYVSALDRLTADCKARGGILAPTGVSTGRPETENVCRITGGASPLTSPR